MMNKVSSLAEHRERKGRPFLTRYAYRLSGGGREAVIFGAGVLISLITPSLFYAVIVGEPQPLVLWLVVHAVGALFGFDKFHQTSDARLSCVPELPRDADVVRPRKAA